MRCKVDERIRVDSVGQVNVRVLQRKKDEDVKERIEPKECCRERIKKTPKKWTHLRNSRNRRIVSCLDTLQRARESANRGSASCLSLSSSLVLQDIQQHSCNTNSPNASNQTRQTQLQPNSPATHPNSLITHSHPPSLSSKKERTAGHPPSIILAHTRRDLQPRGRREVPPLHRDAQARLVHVPVASVPILPIPAVGSVRRWVFVWCCSVET